jgi:SNF2 family DNA or RNA helicase
MEFVPHAYQKEIAQKMIDLPAVGAFLQMGQGKTATTLMALKDLLYDYVSISRVLVIAPKKVAEDTWQAEGRKWDSFRGLRFSTVMGTPKERRMALAADADIYVINRENVKWLCELYKYRLPFDALVVDESTSFKNPQAVRFKALKKCLGRFKKRIILTGTPRPNTLMDLWAQLYLLDGGERLGKTITAYRREYFVPEKQYQGIVYSYKCRNKACEKAIYDKIRDICFTLKEGYKEIPSENNFIYVQIPERAKKNYIQMMKEQVLSLGDEEITALSAAAVSNKLLQMANGAIYDKDGQYTEIHDAKLEALEEIYEANKPLLVFYSYKSDLERIRKKFPEARTLDSAEDVDSWNRGEIPLLLAHPASAGYGLNLQDGGSTIVWFGLTWSLEQYQQANARLKRQGQKHQVIIHHLIARGTIDEQVMKAIRSKAEGQAAMMEAVRMLKENMHG